MDQNPHVARAIEICGSQPALAEKLRCRQQTVSKMLNLEIPVSAEYALLMDSATGGAVPASATRPDLPWPSPSTQPQHQQTDQHQPHADERAAAGSVDAIHDVVTS